MGIVSATCRSCGAPIIWARTLSGRNMPLDAEPNPEGNVVLARGLAIVREKPSFELAGEDEGATRHTSHFATCPNAATHRRRA